MTAPDLSRLVGELRELRETATPGLWTHDDHGGIGCGDVQHALVGATDAQLIVAAINALGDLLDSASETAILRARVALLESALRELDHWAELYLTPRRGMGADLPRSDWPMLAPSAAGWLRRFVERVLKAGRDEG